MTSHSSSERSLWYALLMVPGILSGHRLKTPFQTVSGRSSENDPSRLSEKSTKGVLIPRLEVPTRPNTASLDRFAVLRPPPFGTDPDFSDSLRAKFGERLLNAVNGWGLRDPPSHARRQRGCQTSRDSSALHHTPLGSSQDKRTRRPYRRRASGRDLELRPAGGAWPWEIVALGMHTMEAQDPLGRGPVLSDLTPRRHAGPYL